MEDLRSSRDRRRAPTKPLSRFTFFGRRKKARRAEEAFDYYVDKFEKQDLLLCAVIIFCCFLDIFLTNRIIKFGGSEFNALMRFLMEKGPYLAPIVKMAISLTCLLFLLIHKNFRIFKVIKIRSAIYFVLWVYFALMVYEIYVCLKIVPR
jgi:hypothetical protein